MDIRTLAPNFAVGAQITLNDLDELAANGFTHVVCNRPDSEHPDGAVSAKIARAAQQKGLGFTYLPITPGTEPSEQAAKLASLLSQPGVRVFAYCKSGARAASAWSLAHQTS